MIILVLLGGTIFTDSISSYQIKQRLRPSDISVVEHVCLFLLSIENYLQRLWKYLVQIPDLSPFWRHWMVITYIAKSKPNEWLHYVKVFFCLNCILANVDTSLVYFFLLSIRTWISCHFIMLTFLRYNVWISPPQIFQKYFWNLRNEVSKHLTNTMLRCRYRSPSLWCDFRKEEEFPHKLRNTLSYQI